MAQFEIQCWIAQNLELYLEAILLAENLLERLVEGQEHDLIDIHFQTII